MSLKFAPCGISCPQARKHFFRKVQMTAAPSPEREIQVVYVDDEPDLCGCFAENLQLDGIEVLTFTSPEEAISFLSANPRACRALFTDMQMPRIDGFALLDGIPIRDYPVFLVSGHADASFEKAALQKGFKKIYKKPIDFDLLVQDLKDVL
jgi:DNA-binding NtrC family response regulator